ncbi:MAG: excinuclease ABC subunit C, partial [Ruminococcaceae bacterium]|nr:excinuclease ABC subunit C [Oscillospiraceae bacterium]
MSDERLLRLREKASKLPRSPGVYIMENSQGKVIYVGKSRSLRDRVYQYFVGSHDVKTEKMASSVHDFRFITCQTEIESLALENSLIKQHTPRYNIKLKDAKSYPYLRFTAGEYPRLEVTRTRSRDGATYFGPYSGISTAYAVKETLERTLGLPSCKRKFPEDIGRERPCMYYQTGRCAGLCTGDINPMEYGATVAMAKEILRGKTAGVARELEERMMKCAEEERFEEAARCRDSLAAIRKLGERQKAVGAPDAECDVIAFAAAGKGECAAVFYIRGGYINDSEHFVFGDTEITGFSPDADGAEDKDSPLAAFVMSLYQGREYIPGLILISEEIGEGDLAVLEEYLTGLAGHKVTLRTPQRGDGVRLCEMAAEDAVRHFENRQQKMRREEKLLVSLANLLRLEVVPERIEAYDISN